MHIILFFPSLCVFLHFSKHHSSCCPTSLSVHSRCVPHLLLGALSLRSEVYSLACWMEECTSPWFYLSFCGHLEQHLKGLLTIIKHLITFKHTVHQTKPYSPTCTQYKTQCTQLTWRCLSLSSSTVEPQLLRSRLVKHSVFWRMGL